MASAIAVGSGQASRFEINETRNPLDEANTRPGSELTRSEEEFVNAGGLDRPALMNFLSDVYYEPSWRRASDMDVDYYDGYQLTADQLQLAEERGMPPLIINLIQPVINSVLGLEAKTRSDWEVTFEDDASEQVAIALGKKMTDAERESFADRACSEAYAGQVKAGLGWVEVTDQANPFRYKYRVQSIHRREIWWDWRDTDPGLEEGRYLLRKKWFDDDVLKKLLPMLAPLLGSRESPIDAGLSIIDHLGMFTDLGASLDVERAATMEAQEWRDTERRRSLFYELWYRNWQRGFVVRLPNDTVVELDTKNYEQMQAVAAGVVDPVPAWWPKMRQSFWIGPHRFYDKWSPLPHQNYPYIPFWGFREDLSSMPYGLIRAMRCPQDEINARRSKMMALMSARRMQIDNDALSLTHNTIKQVADSASAHNHVIVLNPARKNGQYSLKIDNNMDLSQAQFSVLQESKEEINQTSGIFTAQQGEARSNQLSGRALETLVDQGNTTLAEINDNYRFGRRLVGERLFAHVKRDSLHPHSVIIGEGKQRKTIALNQRAPDSTGEPINDVAMSTARVILQDVPSTAGYRQRQFLMLTEMTKALPPPVQAFIVDFVIEASDLPERKKVSSRIRKMLNIPEPGDEDNAQAPLPPEVEQKLMESEAIIKELSAKLEKALNTLQTDEKKHEYRMEELDREAELARLKAGAQVDQINAKSAAATAANAAGAKPNSGEEGEITDKEVEQRILTALDDLASQLAQVQAQVQQPRRSVVKEMGDGTFQVISAPPAPIPTQPAQQQAPGEQP